MSEMTVSDFDRRNNGFDISRLDMATQTINLADISHFQQSKHYLDI